MSENVFDLNKYSLNEIKFKLLSDKTINCDSIVNCYCIEWNYIICNDMVRLSTWLDEKMRNDF